MRNKDVVFFDTETTGLDPWRRGTWEVAAIRDTIDGETLRYQAQIPLTSYHLHYLEPKAAEVTKFEQRYMLDKEYNIKDPWVVRKELWEFFKDAHIVGMCPDFDVWNLHFLQGASEDYPKDSISWYYQLIDVDNVAAGIFLAKGFHVNLPFNTSAACKFLGVDRDENLKHSAMYDVEMTRDFWYRLLAFAATTKNWTDFEDIHKTLLTEPEKKD